MFRPRPEERASARLEGRATTELLPHLRTLAAHDVRVFSIDPPSSRTEGAGNAGCGLHPWSACNKKARGRTTGSAGAAGIPCAMVLTAYIVLSPVRPGFVVTVALRHISQSEAPASGRQDHTTSPSAICCSSHNTPRPSHPASNVRDDREAPLLRQRDARMIVVICPTTQAEMCTTGSLRMAGMHRRLRRLRRVGKGASRRAHHPSAYAGRRWARCRFAHPTSPR